MKIKKDDTQEGIKTIKYLEEKCRWDRNPGILGDRIVDKAGVCLAKLLLLTSITPNQITIGGILLGIVGIFLISFPGYSTSIFGYVLLLLFCVTDYADGVVARFRNSTSARGEYYDKLGHFLIPLIFLAVGTHLFHQLKSPLVILIGSFTTIIYLWSDINTKLPTLITGIKSKQAYISSSSGFKGIITKLHKNLTFCIHLVVFFLVAELIELLFKINLTYYLLVFFLIVFILTFILQVILNAKKLKLTREKNHG